MSATEPTLQALQAAYGLATSKFIEAWLDDIAAKDQPTGLAVLRALHAGSFITISSCAAPSTGALSCTLSITDTHGRLSPLGLIDFSAPGGGA